MGETQQKIPNNTRFKYALSYLPFWAFLMMAIEKERSSLFQKHIHYGILLLVGYIFGEIVLRILGLGFLSMLWWILYVWVCVYFAHKVYAGSSVDIQGFDAIIDSMVEKDTKKNNTDF